MDEETNKPPMRKVIGFEPNGLGGYNYHVCRAKIEEIWDGTKIVYIQIGWEVEDVDKGHVFEPRSFSSYEKSGHIGQRIENYVQSWRNWAQEKKGYEVRIV